MLYQITNVNPRLSNGRSYKKLLYHLFRTPFYHLIPLDENRIYYAISMRLIFGQALNYSDDYINTHLGNKPPVSVFEIIFSLSYKLEKSIMDTPRKGNRIGQWFWYMIVSLGLGGMDDNNYDFIFVDSVLVTFISRQYSPDGKGGLFQLENPLGDLREVPIWYQAMWFLNEFIDNEPDW